MTLVSEAVPGQARLGKAWLGEAWHGKVKVQSRKA